MAKEPTGIEGQSAPDKLMPDPGVFGSARESWMDHREKSAIHSISGNDLTLLSALISHVAQASKQSEFRIERLLADHFKIPNITLLQSNSYDEAIRFLVDILESKPPF